MGKQPGLPGDRK
jgi:26S proteasome regulatory subunit T2